MSVDPELAALLAASRKAIGDARRLIDASRENRGDLAQTVVESRVLVGQLRRPDELHDLWGDEG